MFRKSTVVAVALVLLGFMSRSSRAELGVGNNLLLLNRGVQEELKLSPDQLSKLQGVVEKVRDGFKANLDKIGELDAEGRAALLRKVNGEVDQAVSGVLTPDQAKRLHQLNLQSDGAMALMDPKVRAELNVSDAQLGEVKGLLKDSLPQIQQAYDSGDKAKCMELCKSTREKFISFFSDDQKAKWKEMIGKPYDFAG